MIKVIAIHHRKSSYSERWIAYCERHGIPYPFVDCQDSGSLSRLAEARALLSCAGHWDARLVSQEGHVWPEDAILIDLLERLDR